MPRKYFSKVPNLFKVLSSYVSRFFSSVKKYFSESFNNLVMLKYKLKNLAGSNLDLGVYHLRRRNYNDAIFRFKLVDKFLDPDNKLASYWLGWTYFMKQDYKKSIISLTKSNEFDVVGLLPFVKSIDNVMFIPEGVYSIYRDIMADTFLNKFSSAEENIVLDLVTEFNFHAQNLPQEYKVLELGANVGLLGDEINKRMQESFSLTGVEPSNQMIEMQSVYFPDNPGYNAIINSTIEQFLDESKEKYDVVYSLDGFSNQADLKNIFLKIFSVLNTNGYFAFAIKTNKQNMFSKTELCFSYNPAYVNTILKESGFTTLLAKEISLEIKNKYSIFVCTK